MLQSYTKGNQMVLTKFNDYWGGWNGNHLDKIVIKVSTEVSTRLQMIKSGEADFAVMLGSKNLEALSSQKGLHVEVDNAAANVVCFFNMLKKPFDNITVRNALAYAFPYQNVIKYVKMDKYGSLPKDVVAPANVRGATTSQPYTYDMEKHGRC